MRSARALLAHTFALLLALCVIVPDAFADSDAHAGSYDHTFSGNGIAFNGFGPGGTGESYATGFAPLGSGKTLVAGTDRRVQGAVGIARYTEDGELDPGFGDGGAVSIAMPGQFGFGASIAVISNQIYVVAGYATSQGYHSQLLRLHSNGELDDSFGGGDGRIEIDDLSSEPLTAGGILIGPGGKLLLNAAQSSSQTFVESTPVVVELNRDGSPYEGFGASGFKPIDFPARNVSNESIAVGRDGQIAVSCLVGPRSSKPKPSVAVLEKDGSYDRSFSGDGRQGAIVQAIGSGYQYADLGGITFNREGKILTSGTSRSSARGRRDFPTIARYKANGKLDETFSDNGVLVSEMRHPKLAHGSAGPVLPLRKGRILVGADLNDFGVENPQLGAVAMFDRRGRLVHWFGDRGERDLGHGTAVVSALSRARGGDYLVAGSSNSQAFLARLNER